MCKGKIDRRLKWNKHCDPDDFEDKDLHVFPIDTSDMGKKGRISLREAMEAYRRKHPWREPKDEHFYIRGGYTIPDDIDTSDVDTSGEAWVALD